jgi:hypothetical protein
MAMALVDAIHITIEVSGLGAGKEDGLAGAEAHRRAHVLDDFPKDLVEEWNVGTEWEELEWDEEDSGEPFQESAHALQECFGLYFQGFAILCELLLVQYSHELINLLVVLSPECLFGHPVLIP